MSNDAPQTHNFLAELLEGAKALQAMPTLQAERDKIQAELDFHKARLDEYRTWHVAQVNQITALSNEVAAKEAEVKAATFREQEVRSKLETLVTSFRGVIGEVKAAADLANELVEEPKPVPTTDHLGIGTDVPHSAPVAQIGNGFNGDAVNITEGNNVHPFDVEPSNNTLDGTAHQDQTNTVNIPGKLEGGEFRPLASPTQFDTTENGSESTETSREPWSKPSVTEVSHNDGPFDAPSPAETAETASTPTASTGNGADTPAAECKQYWHKPTNTTWADWVKQGGEKAPWVGDEMDYAY